MSPNASDAVIDSVLGTTAAGASFTSSGHLYGDADARASRAFDHDPATAWTGHTGTQTGQWLDAQLDAAVTLDHADLQIVADGRHSVPTRITVTPVGGTPVAVDVPAVEDGPAGTVRTVRVAFPAVTTTGLRLTVDAVREVTTHPRDALPETLPVAIAETGLAGVPTPADPALGALGMPQ